MLFTLRRVLSSPPVRLAFASGAIALGLTMISRLAADYRDMIEIRREELDTLNAQGYALSRKVFDLTGQLTFFDTPDGVDADDVDELPDEYPADSTDFPGTPLGRGDTVTILTEDGDAFAVDEYTPDPATTMRARVAARQSPYARAGNIIRDHTVNDKAALAPFGQPAAAFGNRDVA